MLNVAFKKDLSSSNLYTGADDIESNNYNMPCIHIFSKSKVLMVSQAFQSVLRCSRKASNSISAEMRNQIHNHNTQQIHSHCQYGCGMQLIISD